MKNILINDFDDKFWIQIIKKFCSKGYNLHTVIDYETEIRSINEHNIKCHFISMKDAVSLNRNKYANKKVDTSFIIKHEEFVICLQDLIQMIHFQKKRQIYKKSTKIWFNYLKDNKIKVFFLNMHLICFRIIHFIYK